MNKNKIRVSLILTKYEVEKIKEIAKKEGLSFSDKIRRILDDYLSNFYYRGA